MKSHRLTSGLALTTLVSLGLATGSPAHASFFQNSTGLPSPAQTITFDEVVLPPNTPLTNQYAAQGVTFTNLFYDDQLAPFPNIVGHRVGNFDPQTIDPVFGIHFTTPQTEAAFAMVTSPGTSSFIALLGGVPVETDVAPTDVLANDFYGFQNITFDEIRVAPGGLDNHMLLDNLQTGTSCAPEPGSLALLATGSLPLLGFLRRRKSA